VVPFLGNDIDDCVLSKDWPVADGILQPTVGSHGKGKNRFLQRHSHLVRLALKAYLPFRRTSDSASPLEEVMCRPDGLHDPRVVRAMRVLRDELERIRVICDAAKIELRAAVIPSRHAVLQLVDPKLASRDRPDCLAVSREVATVLSELGIPYVDLGPPLATRGPADTYFKADGHFTPVGHELAAQAIVRAFPELK
jgi:hypothetical protein